MRSHANALHLWQKTVICNIIRFFRNVFYDFLQQEARNVIFVHRNLSVQPVCHQNVFSENEDFNCIYFQYVNIFGIASDKWFDGIIDDNSPASRKCSNCMTEYHSEHFSRKLSDAFVTTFAADVQIFSVTIIMLIAKAIIYLSCFFETVLIWVLRMKEVFQLPEEISISNKNNTFFIDGIGTFSSQCQPWIPT